MLLTGKRSWAEAERERPKRTTLAREESARTLGREKRVEEVVELPGRGIGE